MLLRKRGSVMVEAALILPMIMILAALIINVTLAYYKDVCAQAEAYEAKRAGRLESGAVNNGECEFARRADLLIE